MTTEHNDPLIIWTVYDHPTDFPDNFVARKFTTDANGPRATAEVVVADSLDAIRESMVQRGLTCLTRSPEDEPQIVETWL